MQVIVFDPTQEIASRAEQILAASGVGVLGVGSLHALSSALVAAVPEDIVVARVRQDDDGSRLAASLLH